MVWTYARGAVWVACTAGCREAQADLFGPSPPLYALVERGHDELTEAEAAGGELMVEGGVGPLEGGATNESDGKKKSVIHKL